MSIKLAVNYSHPAADLLRQGQIRIDCLKCPAWPDLIATARALCPVYVHFPLRVGSGRGDALDTEMNALPDWRRIEALLAQTGTPLVNVHLAPTVEDYPGIPGDTADPAHTEVLAEGMIRDLRAVVARFGPGRVIAENDSGDAGLCLQPALLPEVIRRVVEEVDCGFLLDLSHARMAAHSLGMDARAYIAALPIERTRELHVTGIHRLEGPWLERLSAPGIDWSIIQRYGGQLLDHLPLTEEDWRFTGWAMAQARAGVWGDPWVVTFEYGGVGPLWEAICEPEVLARQVPRLYTLVKGQGP